MWYYVDIYIVTDSKGMYTFISTQHKTMRWSHNTMRWYHKKQWGDTRCIASDVVVLCSGSCTFLPHGRRSVGRYTSLYSTLQHLSTSHGTQLPNEVTLVKKPQRKVRCCTWLQPSWLGLRNARAEQLQLLLNLKSKAIHSPIGSQKSEIPQSFSNLYWSPFMMAAVV